MNSLERTAVLVLMIGVAGGARVASASLVQQLEAPGDDLSFFVGAGTFSGSVGATADVFFQGGVPYEFSILSNVAIGSIRLTYEFTSVGALAAGGGPGACCFSTGFCTALSEPECALSGGAFQGPGTVCGPRACVGACCFQDGTCVDVNLNACNDANGVYQGDGTVCLDAMCAGLDCSGACCLPDGSCTELLAFACVSSGGVAFGAGPGCASVACTGACCLPDGTCTGGTEQECATAGGRYRGDATACGVEVCTEIVHSRSFLLPLSPANLSVTFDQFDDLGGTRTLQRVVIEVDVEFRAEVRLENISLTSLIFDTTVALVAELAGDIAPGSGFIPFQSPVSEVADCGVGVFLFPGESCEVSILGGRTPDPRVGACCFDATCVILSQADCVIACGLFLGDFEACGVSTCPPPSAAAWNEPAGGAFEVATNWSPQTVPSAGDDAILDLPGAYVIDVSSEAEANRLLVRNGDATIAFATPPASLALAASTSSLVVGEASGDAAALTVTGAGNVVGTDGRIGDAAGAIGTLTVTGTGAEVLLSEELCVGCAGSGLLEVTAGGRVVSASAVVGDSSLAAGVVTVASGGVWDLPLFGVVERGEVSVAGTGLVTVGPGDLIILRDGALRGDGTVVGGIVNFGRTAPGPAPSTLVVGDYQQVGVIPALGEASGRLEIDIEGPTPGVDHDALAVSGIARLGGGLGVTIGPGFSPSLGQQWPVLTASGFGPNPGDGAFDVASFPGLEGDLFLRLESALPLTGGATLSVIVDQLEGFAGLADPEGFTLGGGPVDAVVGDFDGVNGPDVAVLLAGATESDPGSVVVLLNAGTIDGVWQGFGGSVQTPVGAGPAALTAGLFDADALLDVAVANAADDTLSVLLNAGAGDGTFVAAPPVPVGDEPRGIASGDFTADLVTDLAATNSVDGTLFILTGDGMGGFTITEVLTLGGQPGVIEPEDLDNDKNSIDLVVAQRGGGSITAVFIDGGFVTSARTISVGLEPVEIVTGDLNGDDLPDILVANEQDGTVSIVLNEGSREFAPAVGVAVGTSPRSLVLFDLEPDGDLDVGVVATMAGEQEAVLLRNDRMEPVSETVPLSGPSLLEFAVVPGVLAAADLDEDGADDVVALGGAGGAAFGPFDDSAVRLNAEVCTGDFDDQGSVGFADLSALLGRWGPCPPAPCPWDLDLDGNVGFTDLNELLTRWGTCP